MRNEYLIATGAHRILVLNPDPNDNVEMATWYGVRLAVCVSRRSSQTPSGQPIRRSRQQFYVMLDVQRKDRDFLWNEVTARLPFASWERVLLTVPGAKEQMWRAEIVECVDEFAPFDLRRPTGHDTSEKAAHNALQEVQDMAFDDATHQSEFYNDAKHWEEGHKLWNLGKHTCEWTLDIIVRPGK